MCSVHDTVELERRGIPATVVITRAFRRAADFQFRGMGMAGHALIELPHPISNLRADDVRALALAQVDEIARQLTSAGQCVMRER